MESSELEGNQNLVQFILKTSSDEHSTMYQWMNVLSVKGFFLIVTVQLLKLLMNSTARIKVQMRPYASDNSMHLIWH